MLSGALSDMPKAAGGVLPKQKKYGFRFGNRTFFVLNASLRFDIPARVFRAGVGRDQLFFVVQQQLRESGAADNADELSALRDEYALDLLVEHQVPHFF
jgi:hypothetical protein